MPIDMKSVIAETFVKMVNEKNVDKITVKALINECRISRQTFYYHFQDIMDVLEWAARQAVERLVARSLEAADMRAALRIFITFTVDHYPKIHRLMESQRRGQIETIMIDAVETYQRDLMQYKRPDLSVNYADMDVMLRFNACGLVGILLNYGGNPRLDQEGLALQLEKILSGELIRLEQR